ncbi:MAG: GIY-YIG nuclease family protein [bacterium]
MHRYYIYILTNKLLTVLYIGVTNDLSRRVYEHRNKLVEGFTQKYNMSKLVHYEEYPSILEAIAREKQLKHWERKWKDELISKSNPEWKDLSEKWKVSTL